MLSATTLSSYRLLLTLTVVECSRVSAKRSIQKRSVSVLESDSNSSLGYNVNYVVSIIPRPALFEINTLNVFCHLKFIQEVFTLLYSFFNASRLELCCRTERGELLSGLLRH